MIFKLIHKFHLVFVALFLLPVFSLNSLDQESINDDFMEQQNELLKYVDDFITLPKGGISWNIFGETAMKEYTFDDKKGNEYIGYRPVFSEKIRKLDSQDILVQGYMFPLEQDDEQSLFLLGPFPLSCPYHPHTQSNLLIEVHAKKPVLFSYDAVNIKGELELVAKDDEYNMFYRLKNAELVKN